MELSQADIQTFKERYEVEFGGQADWPEAEFVANELMGLYEAIWEAMLSEVSNSSAGRKSDPPTT